MHNESEIVNRTGSEYRSRENRCDSQDLRTKTNPKPGVNHQKLVRVVGVLIAAIRMKTLVKTIRNGILVCICCIQNEINDLQLTEKIKVTLNSGTLKRQLASIHENQ